MERVPRSNKYQHLGRNVTPDPLKPSLHMGRNVTPDPLKPSLHMGRNVTLDPDITTNGGGISAEQGGEVKQKDDGILISQDMYVADILKKFDFVTVKTASTPIETNNKEKVEGEWERRGNGWFQVTPKVSYLHAVKRIFRYLKGNPQQELLIILAKGFGTAGQKVSTSKATVSIVAPKLVLLDNYEAVFKKWDGRVVRATTTAASLDAAQASGNISKTQSTAMSNDPLSQEISSGGNTPGSDEERIEQDDLMDFVPPTPHDSPLSGGHTPGSDEGRPNINELMAICTNLSNRVLALEQSKTTQDLVIRKLKKKVRKLEKKLRERTPRITLQDCTTDPSTSTTGDIFEDELMTIVDTLMAIRSTRPRTTVVVICNVEEEPRRATPNATVKEKTKVNARILFEEEQAQFEREKRIARERATEQEVKDAALIMKFEDVQARMDADALSYINSFIPMDSKVVKDSGKKDDSSSKQAGSKKKRTGLKLKPKSLKKLKVMKEQESVVDDAEKEELRACLDIVPGDDIAINVKSLTTKYLIVDWKIHILTENIMYYQIIRADESSKNYKIFSEMLDDFNRQDVVDLYNLVKEKVHVLLMDTGVTIHMMVETKYPLTQEMISRMLNRRLEVDHESTMAFELIRFIKA
ncbi:hypothetical protein Tco_0829327 [Tanacetum coccineum]